MTVFGNQRTSAHYVLACIIVCAFSAIVLPFVLVFLLQDIFFHSKEHWFFNAPAMAYIVFGLGFLWILLVLSLYLWLRRWREKRNLRTPAWMFMIIVCGCFIFFYLGVNHYYYFSEEGLYYSDLFVTQGQHYSWTDIHEVHEVLEKSATGVQRFAETVYVTATGKEISIPFNSDYIQNRSKILSKLNEHQIVVQKVFMD